MPEFSVGKEVLSHCNKCKLPLAHIIVVMKDTMTIGKVKCKTCNAIHAYKDPSKATSRRGRKKGSTTKKSADVKDVWLEAMNKATTKSQLYSTKSKFSKGDIIDHPSFGPGVIDGLLDNNKIIVIFRHDTKTLIHNKA
ncbi:MAG: hypothetical protein ISR65_15280 [Bacteriovoracaceae bacterium]|nr:hypothetical protein [Bacteriovoracaceae bacterium]